MRQWSGWKPILEPCFCGSPKPRPSLLGHFEPSCSRARFVVLHDDPNPLDSIIRSFRNHSPRAFMELSSSQGDTKHQEGLPASFLLGRCAGLFPLSHSSLSFLQEQPQRKGRENHVKHSKRHLPYSRQIPVRQKRHFFVYCGKPDRLISTFRLIVAINLSNPQLFETASDLKPVNHFSGPLADVFEKQATALRLQITTSLEKYKKLYRQFVEYVSFPIFKPNLLQTVAYNVRVFHISQTSIPNSLYLVRNSVFIVFHLH